MFFPWRAYCLNDSHRDCFRYERRTPHENQFLDRRGDCRSIYNFVRTNEPRQNGKSHFRRGNTHRRDLYERPKSRAGYGRPGWGRRNFIVEELSRLTAETDFQS